LFEFLERQETKMKKVYITLLIAFLVMPAVGARAQNSIDKVDIVIPPKLKVDLWVDRQDGIYYEGESITIFFSANQDCYVSIYSLDARGRINLLYPTQPWDNGFVYGGEMYAIPADYEDYELIISGPEGQEHIQAIASIHELEIPDWYNTSPPAPDYYYEPEEFIKFVNKRYFNCRSGGFERFFAQTIIYIKKARYYYQPVYVPSSWSYAPYYTSVYIDYPYGGEVYINGIYIGIAPLWCPRVIIGWHWFTIYDHYGYCWERRVHCRYDNYVCLDQSRIKTSRTKTSRYSGLRNQTKNYGRSSYKLSDQKVKTTRSTLANSTTGKSKGTDYRVGKTTKTTSKKTYTTRKSGITKSRVSSEGYNKKGSGKSGSARSTHKSNVSSGKNREGSSSSKATGSYKGGGSRKSSGGSVKRSSGSSRKSSGGSVKRSSGSSRKSSGGSVKRSSGSSRKSSGGSVKKSSGSSRKSSGSKGSSGSKSSSSRGKGGSYSRSSGNSGSPSIGRSSAGRSSPSKSSGGRSSSGRSSSGGGKSRR
jgi:hypothetical protein